MCFEVCLTQQKLVILIMFILRQKISLFTKLI